ncbi:lantibiotic dehydratase [Nocardiopsis sinuspersici]|uniref:lantibiotic dehydratase n=1 Tax=Nocardiopsis sinuspersici TaxID=501010 RepID=UPI003741EE9E
MVTNAPRTGSRSARSRHRASSPSCWTGPTSTPGCGGSVSCGEEPAPHRIRRCAPSLMRYPLRARLRPTPFGLFAGVASAKLGTITHVSWGQRLRGRASRPALGPTTPKYV